VQSCDTGLEGLWQSEHNCSVHDQALRTCGFVKASHLTLKNVQKLQVELNRLKTFRCGDRKIDRELPYLCGQMKQLVRAALKFRKPIAM